MTLRPTEADNDRCTSNALLQHLLDEEHMWLEPLTESQVHRLIHLLCQSLSMGTDTAEDEGEESFISSLEHALHDAVVCNHPGLAAPLCPHLQHVHRTVPPTVLSDWLSPSARAPVAEWSADAGDGEFCCDRVCGGCEAIASLGLTSSVASKDTSRAAHAHCVSCLQRRLRSRRAMGESIGDAGYCLAHMHQHCAAKLEASQAILRVLDGDDKVSALELIDEVAIENAELVETVTSSSSIDEDASRKLDDIASSCREHSCFLVAAGSAIFPVCVLFCVECRMFSPLTVCRGDTRGIASEQRQGGDDDANDAAVAPPQKGTVEPMHVILSRLLLAISVWEQTRVDDGDRGDTQNLLEADSSSWVAVDVDDVANLGPPKSAIFLYKAVLFDDENAIDELEDGVLWTYSAAYLHGATTDDDGCLCLPVVESPDDDVRMTTSGSGISGFLMQYPSEAIAADRLAAVQRRYPTISCWSSAHVYLPTCRQWIVCHVLYYAHADSAHFSKEAEVQTVKHPLSAAAAAVTGSSITGEEAVASRGSNLLTLLLDLRVDAVVENTDVAIHDSIQCCACPFSAADRVAAVLQTMTHVATLMRALRHQLHSPMHMTNA